mmetsp:Transcript_164625/g.400200  ORF Transcript_164625/g.400200 Transcript_164625/m.400200 type:complete len:157 (+) Transcript_164625:63-533(+)
MALLLSRAVSRAAQRAAVQAQAARASSTFADRANPVYPSPWNKWFPYEPVPSTPKLGPYRVKVSNKETYFFCTCGESAAQPFCESGGCKLPGFSPMPFVPRDDGTISLCGCKKAPSHECNGACISLYSDLNPVMASLVGFSGCFVFGVFLSWIFHP